MTLWHYNTTLFGTYNFLENFFSNTSPKSKERVILETPHEHFTQSLGHSPWCSQNWRCNEIPKWEWGLIEFDTYKNSSSTVKRRVPSNSVTYFMEIPEMSVANISMISNSHRELQPFLSKTRMVGAVWRWYWFYFDETFCLWNNSILQFDVKWLANFKA